MTLKTASQPFRFYTRLNLVELTGRRAKNTAELLKQIEEVEDAVIYHHTHRFLQQYQYLSPEPPNDFAYWVREILDDPVLGELLQSINVCDYDSISALRKKIADTIRNHLASARKSSLKTAPEGGEFYFLKSRPFIFHTPYEARTLEEFLTYLQEVSIDSLYFHLFEARLRLGRSTNDFSFWLETSLGEAELAEKICRLDPYTHTLAGLKNRIVVMISKRLKEEDVTVGRDY
ncbi:MAG: DUF5752 family protein [Candidatus Brocadiales bacterium]|nr:DUF5752 family protein [Candidatus Bathyanammoxibius amoris]